MGRVKLGMDFLEQPNFNPATLFFLGKRLLGVGAGSRAGVTGGGGIDFATAVFWSGRADAGIAGASGRRIVAARAARFCVGCIVGCIFRAVWHGWVLPWVLGLWHGRLRMPVRG